MKRILIILSLLVAVVTSTLSTDAWIQAETAFSIHFANAYASINDTIALIIEGADPQQCEIIWKADGEIIQRNETQFIAGTEHMEKLIEVEVSDGITTLRDKLLISELPVVYIDVENGAEVVSKDEYLNANIRISGTARYPQSVYYEGITEIKGRGNSTWGLPKKPYRLKLDEKANLFGMSTSKHWTLLANYLDESLLRNQIAFEMSEDLGLYAVNSVFVDVVFNGEKVGNYQLCEHIRVDEERVNVFDWEGAAEDIAKAVSNQQGYDKALRSELEDKMIQDLSWITSGSYTFYPDNFMLDSLEITISDYLDLSETSGGYLIELDDTYDELSKFYSSLNQPIMIKSPEYLYTNTALMNELKAYINGFESSISNRDDFTVTMNGQRYHYSELFDLDALVSYFLIQEIFFNYDSMKRSTYMYQDLGGRMIMGPAWDFDYSSGNDTVFEYADRWETLYYNYDTQQTSWFKLLIQDPYFVAKLRDQYLNYRDELEKYIQSDGVIEEYIAYLSESAKENAALWHENDSFERNAKVFQDWMLERFEWLDAQFESQASILTSLQYDRYQDFRPVFTQTQGADTSSTGSDARYDIILDSGYDLCLNINDIRSYQLYINETYYGEVNNETIVSSDLFEEEATTILVLKDENSNTSSYALYKQRAGQVDTSHLEALIQESAQYSASDYDSASFAHFNTVRTESIELLSQPFLSQTEIDEQILLLQNAISQLVPYKVYPVSNLHVSEVVNHSAELSWTASETADVSYQIVNLNTDEIVVDTIDCHYTLTEILSDTQYRFAVYAIDRNERQSEPVEISVYVPAQLPDSVSGLHITQKSYKAVQLMWEPVEGAEEYDIYRKGYKEDSVFEYYETTTENQLIISGLMSGKTYSFYVVAKNNDGQSQPSDAVSFATQLEGDVTLSIEKLGKTRFILNWNKIDGATRYIIYRRREGEAYRKVLTLGADDLSYTTGYMAAGSYDYVVRAGRYDSLDRIMSDKSNAVSAVSEFDQPELNVSAGVKSAKLSWTSIEGVTHYEIYRSTGAKYYKIKTLKDHEYTMKSLVSGKKYYFKVRGYRLYSKTKVYSEYSSAKAVKPQ